MRAHPTAMRVVGCIVVSGSNLSSQIFLSHQLLGMSMRLAFDLGLHLDMTSYVNNGDMSSHEADVRRTAFWGSYVADQ